MEHSDSRLVAIEESVERMRKSELKLTVEVRHEYNYPRAPHPRAESRHYSARPDDCYAPTSRRAQLTVTPSCSSHV